MEYSVPDTLPLCVRIGLLPLRTSRGLNTHLLIFASGGLVLGAPPLVREGALAPLEGGADPLPQALVLTAIVIAFAVLAFALVLGLCAGEAGETDDLEAYGGERG